MSTRTTPNGTAERKRSRQQPSSAPDDGDRALAEIRAWTELLVARGNRLREAAEREREALHADSPAQPRPQRDARTHAKPLA